MNKLLFSLSISFLICEFGKSDGNIILMIIIMWFIFVDLENNEMNDDLWGVLEQHPLDYVISSFSCSYANCHQNCLFKNVLQLQKFFQRYRLQKRVTIVKFAGLLPLEKAYNVFSKIICILHNHLIYNLKEFLKNLWESFGKPQKVSNAKHIRMQEEYSITNRRNLRQWNTFKNFNLI